MEISISTTDIYGYVKALTTRIGMVKGNLDAYACTEDRYGILSVYMDSVVSEAEGELRKQLSVSNDLSLSMSQNGTAVTISLTDHAGCLSDSVSGLIRTQLRLYCAYALVALWMELLDADVRQLYLENAGGCIAKVIGAMNQRNAPDVAYDVRSDDSRSLDVGIGPDVAYDVRSDDDIVIRKGHCPESTLLVDEDGDALLDEEGDFLIIKTEDETPSQSRGPPRW